MGRRLVFPLVALCLVASSRQGLAGPPDQAMSLIPEQLTISTGPQFLNNPIGTNRVVINDAAGLPVQGATVYINLQTAAGMIAWCPGNGPGLTSGEQITDESGAVTFTLFGGGCFHPDPWPNSSQSCISNPGVMAPAYVIVYAPGGAFAFSAPIYYISAPDAVNNSGRPPRCDPPRSSCDVIATLPRSLVALSDAVWHSQAIKAGLRERCTKFTPPFDGPVSLADAIFVTSYIKAGSICACQ